MKVLGLEDTVQSLNDRLYEQQKELDALRSLCRMLLHRQDEQSAGSARTPVDERPPHY